MNNKPNISPHNLRKVCIRPFCNQQPLLWRGLGRLLLFLPLIFASCMDSDHDIPDAEYTGTTFELSNVMSIQDLKESYKSYITGSSMTQIDKDIQVVGTVTGNDEGGNIYNEITLQDNSGAIVVAVSQSGLYGTFPVGAQVAINLKGLYIGGYGSQAEIGGVYTNARTGATGIGGMDRFLWKDHWMLLSKGKESDATALMEEFDYSQAANSDYLWKNQAKLMRLSNVTFKNGNGKTVFSSKDDAGTQTAVNRGFVGLNDSRLVMRTSTYAKFAADTIPQGKTSVVGIFTVYRNTWQILARSRNDAYGIIK